jgi:hypothetical protein
MATAERTTPVHGDRVARSLVAWCSVLLVLLAAHDASHLIDDGLDTSVGQLAPISIPQWIVLAAIMTVIVRGDRARGGLAALMLGAGTTLGCAVAHLLPFALYSYWDRDPSTASWLLAWVPTALGAVIAARAWFEWRAATPARQASPA